MGLVRYLFVCVSWCLFISLNVSAGCHYDSEDVSTTALADGVSEPRGRHRLQLLFPLLLRISTRLATLVPTALMGLLGIILFVVFSKKALIISLFALFLTLADKYKNKNEEIHIHKVNSYEDYNDEEHIHYHHGPKYGKPYYYHYQPHKRKKFSRRTLPVLPHIPYPIPLNDVHVNEVLVQPFKPLGDLNVSKITKLGMMNQDTSPVLFPSAAEEDRGHEPEEWNSLE